VGHEGVGSLLSALRGAGLALELSASSTCNPTFSLFRVSVKLTDDGVKNVDAVTRMLYKYIQLIQDPLFDAVRHAVHSPCVLAFCTLSCFVCLCVRV